MSVDALAEALMALVEKGGEGPEDEAAAGQVAGLLRLDKVFFRVLSDIRAAPTPTAKHVAAHLVASALIAVRREVGRLLGAMDAAHDAGGGGRGGEKGE